MDKQSKSRFNYAPTISKSRTRFDLSHSVLTSMNTGDFHCVLMEPVYPGETWSLKTASLTRLETSIHQTMDNAYIEFAYFFVPYKLVWTNFEKFLGANDDPWTQTTEYHIPQLILGRSAGSTSDIGVEPQSILNQLGVPVGRYKNTSIVGHPHFTISALPLRSIFQVYNDWYRDENLDSIIYFDKDNNDVYLNTNFLFNGGYINPARYHADGLLDLKVNRFKDLFSTALPAPQKGSEVTFGLTGFAPVGYVGSSSGELGDIGLASMKSGSSTFLPLETSSTSSGSDEKDLVANLGAATAVTINQLRIAIATQAILERDARGGTRMKEKLYSVWGVDAPDSILDRAEFLGGKRIPVNMMEVLQTSETGTTVLGTDAGHSKTSDVSDGFVRSFSQYGVILGFAYVRTSRSYSQGIDRKLRDRDKYDLFDPMLENIGEVPIRKSELYAVAGTDAGVETGDEVFGYQEAWYHLKERTNQFRGYFQTGISGTLASWHYGDNYSSSPQLSASWLKEGSENVDRTIAVSSSISYQWTLSLHFELHATRTMKKYSIPNTFGF